MQAIAFNPTDAASRITGAAAPPRPVAAGSKEKAWAAAQDFEAVFLNTMMQHMFTGMEGEGPLGGKGAAGVWRSFLTQEYSRTIAKAGGIGIADHVYRSLITQQEAKAS